MWRKPCATSTPLKGFPEKVKPFVQSTKPVDIVSALLNDGYSDSKDQNQVVKGKTAKKNRKNKSSYYFDVSSSSSSSSDDDKVIEIKISAEKKSAKNNFLLENEELDKDKPVKQKGVQKLNTSKTHSVKKVSPLCKLRNKKVKVTTRIKNNKKNDKLNSFEKHSVDNELIIIDNEAPSSSDASKENMKENLIVTEDNEMKIINNIDFVNKLNNKTTSNCEKLNINKLAAGKENKKLIPLVDFNKSNKKSALKHVNNNNVKKLKSFEQLNDELKPVLTKYKARKLSNVGGPIQKLKTKPTKPKPGERLSMLHSWDEKKNSSHQLFSDSKEQELINSLDLKEVETNEQLESPCKKKSPVDESKGEFSKTSADQKEEIRRSRRRRQAPKEYWLSESPSSEPDNKKQRVIKEVSKIKKVPLTLSLKNNKKSVKATKTENKKKQESSALNSESLVLKEFIVHNQNNQETPVNELTNAEIKQSMGNSNKIKNKVSKSSETIGNRRQLRSNKNLRKSVGVHVVTNEENKLEEKTEIHVEDKNNKTLESSDSMIPAVFKNLCQLSFNKEIQKGCYKSDCWSLKNFKCGVLKIKSESHISSKNSQDVYFGGVLIEGNLKMKIGNKELEMKKGDLAFVPPLTEWTTYNFSKTDSLFYYWRGSFKTLR